VYGLGRGIGTGTGNHRNPTGHPLHRQADHLTMFVLIQRRGFTGGTHGHDGIATLFDMKLDQPVQASDIYPSVSIHRCDQCHNATLNHASHFNCHPNSTKAGMLTRPGLD